MKKLSTIFVFLLAVCFVHAQDKPSSDKVQDNKANQVLTNAHKAVSKKKNVNDIKGFTLTWERKRQLSFPDGKILQTSKSETGLALPDKIYQNTTSNQTNSIQEEKYVLNGNSFYWDFAAFVDGKLQNFDKGMIKDEQQLSYLKRETFLLNFPITLDSSWYIPLQFDYVGIAESKDGKAEVIEAVSSNNIKYRLFFDNEKHLLLLMTESWTTKDNKPFENKYFYSDYREKDGILIATKIVNERNGEVFEEKEIKDVKFNPTFKPDTFEVKRK
ncbi:MAG: hypothetical protein ACR2J3_00055 [Aridibacter sp.]